MGRGKVSLRGCEKCFPRSCLANLPGSLMVMLKNICYDPFLSSVYPLTWGRMRGEHGSFRRYCCRLGKVRVIVSSRLAISPCNLMILQVGEIGVSPPSAPPFLRQTGGRRRSAGFRDDCECIFRRSPPSCNSCVFAPPLCPPTLEFWVYASFFEMTYDMPKTLTASLTSETSGYKICSDRRVLPFHDGIWGG